MVFGPIGGWDNLLTETGMPQSDAFKAIIILLAALVLFFVGLVVLG